MCDQSITRAGARRLRSSVRWRLASANCEPLPTTLEEGPASLRGHGLAARGALRNPSVSLVSNAASRLVLRLLRFRPLRAALRLELGRDVKVEGRVWLSGPGRVRVGDGVRLLGRRSAIELHAHEGGEIVIDCGALIEDGSSLEATRSVRIGARSRIGPFCKIMDNHFHRAAGDRRDRPDAVPVDVGEDALVGPRSVILPGASMGDGAVLGPATVLSFRLPAGAVFPGSARA